MNDYKMETEEVICHSSVPVESQRSQRGTLSCGGEGFYLTENVRYSLKEFKKAKDRKEPDLTPTGSPQNEHRSNRCHNATKHGIDSHANIIRCFHIKPFGFLCEGLKLILLSKTVLPTYFVLELYTAFGCLHLRTHSTHASKQSVCLLAH